VAGGIGEDVVAGDEIGAGALDVGVVVEDGGRRAGDLLVPAVVVEGVAFEQHAVHALDVEALGVGFAL